jgi:hypothetical protein
MTDTTPDQPHPRFTEFRDRALQNPEVRAAYEHAQHQTMQQNPDGSWSPAVPLGWLEEHNAVQRLILLLLGRGHCGKRGWRTGVGY